MREPKKPEAAQLGSASGSALAASGSVTDLHSGREAGRSALGLPGSGADLAPRDTLSGETRRTALPELFAPRRVGVKRSVWSEFGLALLRAHRTALMPLPGPRRPVSVEHASKQLL